MHNPVISRPQREILERVGGFVGSRCTPLKRGVNEREPIRITIKNTIKTFSQQSNPCVGLAPSLVLLVLLLSPPALVHAQSKNVPVVSKWGRFEHSFKSSVAYSNALQDAMLVVTFTSPLGETNQVYGFWDGGRTWRVRFSPSELGHWSFKTICSDTANKGLHNQSGEFICTVASGPTRFNQHGPVRVALDRRHFEHEDGTPFFWLADTTWNGARVSAPKDWELYARVRSTQKFTVVQWAAAPGEDAKRESAVSGFSDRIGVNPGVFQRLDAKLDQLSQAGLLSAIVPLWETPSPTGAGPALAEVQAALLVRYVVARWGAEPVVWLLACDGDRRRRPSASWKKIGQAIFAASSHAPVLLYCGDTPALLEDFKEEKWVDAFGYQNVTNLTDEALKAAFSSAFIRDWKKEPVRPLIPFAPYENGIAPSQKRFTSKDTRRAVYWGLLASPPAGVSYGGQGVVNWDETVQAQGDKIPGADLPAWHKAMFMPAAKQLGYLARFAASNDFWRLRPQPAYLASQPGNSAPGGYIAAAGTEAKDLSVVYVPEERTLNVLTNALPPSPSVTWLNPRTGESNPAVAVVGANSCQLPTPDPGDWLLIMRAGKSQ